MSPQWTVTVRPGRSGSRVDVGRTPTYVAPMTSGDAGQWWSIEVLNGPFSAQRWRDAHGRALFEAAVTHRALDWSWHETEWGLVLEVEFPDAESWSAFRRLPGVQAALDAVPDPARGLFVFP